jgi:class 3 adenylate cyclase/pimeloyl-ACP methyl ester carboxylesterase
MNRCHVASAEATSRASEDQSHLLGCGYSCGETLAGLPDQDHTSVVVPETQYLKTPDGVYIAYQVVGEGPVDFVQILGSAGNVEILRELPVADFYRRLASFSRLILHDRRGTGLSDRMVPIPNLETRAQDLLAVLDAVGSTEAVISGSETGGAVAALFAATYPALTRALILAWPVARGTWAPDYPWGEKPETQERYLKAVGQGWGTEAFAARFVAENAPSHAGDAEAIRRKARMQRHFITPGAAVELERIWYETDVLDVLGAVRTPTLITDLADAEWGPGESRYIASLIPNATLRFLPGRDPNSTGVIDASVEAIEEFLEVEPLPVSVDRVLSTVLFTDVVGSTRKADELGDHAWKDLLSAHQGRVRAELARYRGREIDARGEECFARFDGPARAVHCAIAITRAVQDLGIQVRAGVHTGEVELVRDEVRGIAVHIGARVASLAGPDEVLVSSTVKDLVAGSGLAFEDAGEHELKGVPNRWRLYSVVSE